MPDNNPNVPIPISEWVDLYDLTGITVGEPLHIKNIGVSDIFLTVQATKPDNNHDAYDVIRRGDDIGVTNNRGDPGAWAFSNATKGLISVSEREGFKPTLDTTSKSGMGSGINLDAWGTQKIVFDKSLFHGLFTFDVSPYMWIIYEDNVEVANSASVRAASISGRLSVVSGSTAGNSCIVEGRRHPRYQPDRGLKWAASIGFKDANLDGVLKAGFIVNGENGVYLKTKGDGFLYACVMNDGVEIEELITFPFEIDITLGNNYDIQLQWRGVGFVRFFAANPTTGRPEEIHKMNFLNTLDEKLLTRNPAFSVGYHAENITQEVSLWSGCADVTAEGGIVDREQYGEHSADRTVTSGATSGGIIALRNPALAPNGKINTRDLSLARVTVTADKKSTIKVYQTRDLTAITGGSWDAHRDGSFVEVNTTFTALDFAKMQEFSTFKPAAGATIIKENPSKDTIDFYAIHGDYIVVACIAGANVAAEVSIEWGEEI